MKKAVREVAVLGRVVEVIAGYICLLACPSLTKLWKPPLSFSSLQRPSGSMLPQPHSNPNNSGKQGRILLLAGSLQTPFSQYIPCMGMSRIPEQVQAGQVLASMIELTSFPLESRPTMKNEYLTSIPTWRTIPQSPTPNPRQYLQRGLTTALSA